MQMFLVFIGGGLGSLVRFCISKMPGIINYTFPQQTLISNILACLILGLISGYSIQQRPSSDFLKYFVGIGFCGGFSTFSTFSLETIILMKSGYTAAAGANILLSMVFCFAALFAGMILGRSI